MKAELSGVGYTFAGAQSARIHDRIVQTCSDLLLINGLVCTDVE